MKPILLFLSCAAALCANAEITMPSFFSDNMLIQRETDANLWGKAAPNQQVTVTTGWSHESYSTQADADGKWKIAIPTPGAGGPYAIEISDGTPVTIDNVLVGDLWICSGQSNMEMPMKGYPNQPIKGSNMDVAKSKNSNIRLFTVKRATGREPREDVTGSWSEANPANVRDFSATAYYFGRQVEETAEVPVGLLVVAWGGSACEAWMNEDMLQAFPEALAKIPQGDEKPKSKQRTPTYLFNGMVSPIIGLSMKGVIWYQGEDNWNRAHYYAPLFSTMIQGWRDLWQQGDFPFYYCQIAPYEYSLITNPGETLYNSAYLREAQAQVESKLPNLGMAVLMDAGFREGIHPSNKQAAGERLALQALDKTYKIEGISSDSPTYKGMEIKNDTIVVSFDRAPLWICSSHGYVSTEFKVAGEDRVFHPAKAWINREHVYVKSDEVPNPIAVRYAFENYADGDLMGANGLPVSSFRSDDWPDECPVVE